MSEMKPWPEKPVFDSRMRPGSDAMNLANLSYERARADVAMERLRKCEQTLMFIATSKFQYPPERLINAAALALAAIGEIPE